MSTSGSLARSLPSNAGKVYPKAVSGRWRTIKTAVLWSTTGVFFLLPLLRWSRGEGLSDQALLFDFAAGRAYVLWLEFWPQDLFLLSLVLIASALALFLTNTLVGRVWCGFSCPQTLWTDLYMMVERRFEGDRNERMRRDAAPATASGRTRKLGKHVVWLAIALATGLTIVSYFVDAGVLWPAFFSGSASITAVFFVLTFMGTTYLLAGFAREKVCIHMCPWPRFQAAMIDIDTRTVTYKDWRGEPRGPLKRQAVRPPVVAEATIGDCVDCNLCVAVCPTGVDIRQGLQLGCIGCGLCADACDSVMEKVGSPLGLIAFTSEREVAQAQAQPVAAQSQGSRLRVRPVAFAALLVIALGLVGFTLVNRSSFGLTLNPERSVPYVQLSDGGIRNSYVLRVTDRRAERAPIDFAVDGLASAALAFATEAGAPLSADALSLDDSGSQASGYRLSITIGPQDLPRGRVPLILIATDAASGTEIGRVQSYFWSTGSTEGRP